MRFGIYPWMISKSRKKRARLYIYAIEHIAKFEPPTPRFEY